MDNKKLEKDIEKVLKKSKKPLDQVEIARKINDNPFIVSRILHKFERKGMVAVEWWKEIYYRTIKASSLERRGERRWLTS